MANLDIVPQEPARRPRGGLFASHVGDRWSCHAPACPLAPVAATALVRLGWAVLLVRRDDDVRTLKLPDDLPVSVRPNTDGSVGMTIGHDDDGEALLADLRALMGSDGSAAEASTRREAKSPMS